MLQKLTFENVDQFKWDQNLNIYFEITFNNDKGEGQIRPHSWTQLIFSTFFWSPSWRHGPKIFADERRNLLHRHGQFTSSILLRRDAATSFYTNFPQKSQKSLGLFGKYCHK